MIGIQPSLVEMATILALPNFKHDSSPMSCLADGVSSYQADVQFPFAWFFPQVQRRTPLNTCNLPQMRTNLRLGRDFYAHETTLLARELLGKTLVRVLDSGDVLAGIVVEVEAYLSVHDPASHSFRGPGKKNASMYRPAGTLYVYPIHAKYCMNVVTEASGQGAAVLIRAVQPIQGVVHMIERRGKTNPKGSLNGLTAGPARLCQAFGVDRTFDGEDLITSRRIWLEREPALVANYPWTIRTSGRIGISQAADRQLRWFIDGHRYVSGCARDHSRRRDWIFETEEKTCFG